MFVPHRGDSLRLAVVAALAALVPSTRADEAPPPLAQAPHATPRNVIFILVDDLRHDVFGFAGHPFLETPHLDALARGGVHFRNAFVTTSLCSPSRATILTGLYAHRHRVVDNNNPVPPGTTFFPQYLQAAGYETAFIGKWHMGGDSDAPRPGFDRWVSFRGQGVYPPGRAVLNVDGRHVPRKDYITDELTDYAIDWLKDRRGGRPFFLYLAHKAVHSEFLPAERHQGRYAGKPFVPPATMNEAPELLAEKPRWVRDQRNSFHGVGFPYHGKLDIAEYYRRYCETLLAVDDSVGRIVEHLRSRGLLDSTLILFMGDNGFAFGEHGLIDKRTSYEESIRVPLLMHCPDLVPGPKVVENVVANLDIAPTILEAAGLVPPEGLDGRSILGLAQGRTEGWRTSLLYEYYWERNFPHTPTQHALRTDRYKYIHYHGIWDTDELYDLQADPLETRNLIRDPAHKETVARLNKELFDTLEATGGMNITLYRDRGSSMNLRNADGPRAADFPPSFYRKP
jgi:N-acetylglucosamine-6-sulfatase